MPSRSARTESAVTDFAAVRAELNLPAVGDSARFPADVQAEAARLAAQHAFGNREDATDLPLVTIDPPSSMDLDQAMLVRKRRRRGGGFTAHYAIADLPAFVRAGGPLDAETQRRGQTLYLPDAAVPLHPPVLSAGAASLLPDQVRPAALWTIDLDADGEPIRYRVRRALVRSVARLDYQGVQADLDAGRAHPSIEALRDLGRLRRALALARGAVELELPEQQIERHGRGWRIVLRRRTAAEVYNAEISLLTGMCAAQLMLQARIGVLRTLPVPDGQVVAALRHSAEALGVAWPDGATPGQALATLDPTDAAALAVYTEATRMLRGAGYVAFDGAAPEHTWHTGIGAPYTHVTAPLRRLVDRYAAEVCLAVSAGTAVPEWTRAALPMLPELMAASDRRAAQVERACLDQVESTLLAPRLGQYFAAVVLRGTNRDDRDSRGQGTADVFISDPPTLARCTGADLPDGARVTVRLVQADPVARKVLFEARPPAGGQEQGT